MGGRASREDVASLSTDKSKTLMAAEAVMVRLHNCRARPVVTGKPHELQSRKILEHKV